MNRKNYLHLLEVGIAIAVALAFTGGWLACRIYTAANPPGFAVVQNYKDEIPLIRLEKLDGKILQGNFEGREPRFLLGTKEELVVPEHGKFRLDLSRL